VLSILAEDEKDPAWDLDSLPLRPLTRKLIDAIMLDVLPSGAAVLTDFGIDSQQHYEALYYPVRAGEITPMQLEKALGNGPRLTELTRGSPSNPHRDIEFKTSWDGIYNLVRRPARPAPCPAPAPPRARGKDR
jgi:hypothetical protein